MPDVNPAIFHIKNIAEQPSPAEDGMKKYAIDIEISNPLTSTIHLSLTVLAKNYAQAPFAATIALRQFVRSLQLGVDSLD